MIIGSDMHGRRLRLRSIFLIMVVGLMLLAGCRSQPAPSTALPTGTKQPTVTEVQRESDVAPADRLSQQARAMLQTAQDDLQRLATAPLYEIQLKVDFATLTFQGQEVVYYTNNEKVTLERVYFRLLPNGHASYGNGSLEVTDVLVDGLPAAIHLSVSDTVLEVQLPEGLKPGEAARFDLAFAGVVPRDFGGAETPAGYGIYNYSDQVLALSGWYPILAVYDEDGWNLDPVSPIGDSVYSDIAFYLVDLTAPREVVVASTGIQVDSQEAANGLRRQYASGPARDFFLIMSSKYKVTSAEVDGTLVNAYYLPGAEEGGQAALAIAQDSLHIFNQKFGPYPYNEFDIAAAPMRNALGVEYPGVVLVADQLYADPEQPSFVIAVAHEVAHQWWYNVVGNDVFDEPWLDEALTTYSSSLYYQEMVGAGAYRGFTEYWQARYEEMAAAGNDDVITASLAYFESLPAQHIYGGVVYTKGALFFKALRDEIGDQHFFTALQNYYRDHQYQIARSEDLLAAFEETAGEELDDLYQEWLYSARR